MKLSTLAKKIKYVSTRSNADKWRLFCPTKCQREFLQDPAPNGIKLFLAGNQIGKSSVGIYELICRCLGKHPFLKVDPPPIEALMICYTHSQKRIMEAKLWDMLPKDEIIDTEYRHGYGFVGVNSIVKFANGSIIRIASSGNKAAGVIGSTINFALIDEPIEESTLSEIIARTNRGGKGVGHNGARGVVAMTMTPVGGIDCSYLKKMIEEEIISVTHGRLSVENTTPIDIVTNRPLRPMMSEEQVAAIIRSYLPIDREARVSGSLDGISVEGLIFEHFEPAMISNHPVPPGGRYVFCLGIDHGTTPNSQVAILACVDTRDTDARLYILDEYVSSLAPPEHHARAILDMISRNGLNPEEIRWTGDGLHTSGRGKSGNRISNMILVRAFEKIGGFPPGRLPWKIRKVRKARYSVYYGISMIASIMARRHFQIKPRCKHTIESIQNYVIHDSNSKKSAFKYGHCLDAMRYAIVGTMSYHSRSDSQLMRI